MAKKRAKGGSGGPKRRVPTQERSKRRLGAIVEAAARRFADDGYDATTMERIAEEARTSIGSLYQFFPNKRAVFLAVAQECLERSSKAFVELLGSSPQKRPWTELLDAVVDGYATLSEQDATFRASWTNLQMYEDYAEEDAALVRQFIGQVAALLAFWMPKATPRRRELIATMMVQTTMSLMFVSGRSPPGGSKALVEETKVMLRRYLEPYLAELG